MSGRIIIVDDEVELSNALAEMLGRHGYEAHRFTNGHLALEAMRETRFDILLADLMMPEMDGITLLKSALKFDPQLVAIMMTGQGTVQTAVDAMKAGAFDYILKPFKLNTLLTALTHSLEIRRLREENQKLRGMIDIYELGKVVASTLDTETILTRTAEAVIQVTASDEVSILIPNFEARLFEIAVTGGNNRDQITGLQVTMDGTIAGWVAQNKEPMWLTGPVNDQRFKPAYPREDISMAVCMPMMVGRNLVGIINSNFTRQPPNLLDGQVKELTILANIAASAVENARLYEQTERRMQMLSALRSIDLAISSSLDVRVTLKILLDQIAVQLGVDKSAVFLANPNTQTMELSASLGFHTDAIQNEAINYGAGQIGEVVLERKTILIERAQIQEADTLLNTIRSSEEFERVIVTPLAVRGEVKGVMVVFHQAAAAPGMEWLAYFEDMARQAAIGIDSAQLVSHLQRSNQNLTLAYNATIEGWSRALDLRDEETEGHARRVTEMTLRLAEHMQVFEPDDMIQIRRGALLHDIGKMGVPDNILRKRGKLTKTEEDLMRKHPEDAYQMLYPIIYLRKALDIPRYHHERWDGQGYPVGLAGEEIPLAARLFSVIDVWDALSHQRPYRKPWPIDQVIEYIREQAGHQFDPAVVAAFIDLLEKDNQLHAAPA